LFHVISWSWWVVLAGLWVPIVLILLILGICLALAFIAAVLQP
jgi:hypothetical protein